VYKMELVIIEEEEAVFGGKCGASHCNQWDGDILVPNYFGMDLLFLLSLLSVVKRFSEKFSVKFAFKGCSISNRMKMRWQAFAVVTAQLTGMIVMCHDHNKKTCRLKPYLQNNNTLH